MHSGIRVFAAFAMLLGVAFSAAGASAQIDGDAVETSCTTVDFGGQKLIIGRADRTTALPVSLPAGTIDIPSARATDGYPTRGSVSQNSEKYEIEFLDADGNIIATSAPTGDVPDNLVFAEWVGSLGSVELPEPAFAVRAHHRPDLPGDNSPQSVLSNEVTFCFEVSTSDPTPVCGDEGVTSNPDGTPCDPTPVCGDEGVTNNPDGTPCTPVPTTEGETVSPTVTAPTTTEGEEVAGPTTSTTIAPTTTVPTTAAPTTAAPTTAAEEVAGPTDNTLPVTGSNSALLLILGGVMLLAGGAITVAGRRIE